MYYVYDINNNNNNNNINNNDTTTNNNNNDNYPAKHPNSYLSCWTSAIYTDGMRLD